MLEGFSTPFDFERAEVRKGWWKYSRQFGKPLDMRAYYQVEIPSDLNDGNVDIIVYTQTRDTKGSCGFFLGIATTAFKDQSLQLISGFKKAFYIDHYLNELSLREKLGSELAHQYEKAADKKEMILIKIAENQNIINEIKNEIRKIEIY